MTTASLAWAEFSAGERARRVPVGDPGHHRAYAMHDIGTTTISLHIGVLMAVLVGRAGGWRRG